MRFCFRIIVFVSVVGGLIFVGWLVSRLLSVLGVLGWWMVWMVVIVLAEFKCRQFDKVVLPCNWLFGGICGADGRKCDVDEVKDVA
jgi:hypothetical protein